MKTIKLLVAAVLSATMALSVVAQAAEHMGEAVHMKALPPAVQKTITEKAAGGEIVRVEKGGQ